MGVIALFFHLSPCIAGAFPYISLPRFQRRGRSSGVERNLAKVEVEGSNPFARSNKPRKLSLLSVKFFSKVSHFKFLL